VRAQITFQSITAMPEDAVVNTMHFSGDATGSGSTILNKVRAFYLDGPPNGGKTIAQYLSPDVSRVGTSMSRAVFPGRPGTASALRDRVLHPAAAGLGFRAARGGGGLRFLEGCARFWREASEHSRPKLHRTTDRRESELHQRSTVPAGPDVHRGPGVHGRSTGRRDGR